MIKINLKLLRCLWLLIIKSSRYRQSEARPNQFERICTILVGHNSLLLDFPICSLTRMSTIKRLSQESWKSRKEKWSLSAPRKWGSSRFGNPFHMKYWKMRDQVHKCLLHAIWKATKIIRLYTNSWWKSSQAARNSPCRNWKHFWWEIISISCRLNKSAKRRTTKIKAKRRPNRSTKTKTFNGFRIQITSPRIF